MENGEASRIFRLLNRLSESDFQITDEQLKIISNNLPSLCLGQPIDERFLISYLKRVIDIWNNSSYIISTKAIFLIANIITTICTNEELFLTLRATRTVEQLVNILRSIPEIQDVSSYQDQYIRALERLLTHQNGLEWLIEKNYWHDILVIIVRQTDDSVLKTGYMFLTELLDKSKNDYETFHENVINTLLTPLMHLNPDKTLEMIVDTEKFLPEFGRGLSILENILSAMLKKCCVQKNFKFINTLQEIFKIEELLEELSRMELMNVYHLELYKLISLVTYFILAKYLKEHCSNETDRTEQLNYYSAKIYDMLLKASQSTKGYLAVLQLLNVDHVYFREIVNSLIGHHTIITEFQFQTLAFLVLPLTRLCYNYVGRDRKTFDEDEIKEQAVTKIIRNILPETFRTLSKLNRNFTIVDALTTFNHIQNCASFYEHDVVICIVQVLFYLLSNIIRFLQEPTNLLNEDSEEFLKALLETMIYLITEFDISWKDSVEILQVTDNVGLLLKLTKLTPKVTTRALQLMNVSLRKNLLPHSNLLIDRKLEERHFRTIRKMFSRFLIHENWEVRNTIVQVIHALAQTRQEYDSTKATMLELNFPEIIMNMITTDPEIAVKVSSIRCLGDMLSMDSVWNGALRIPNFYDKILQMFYLETNGVIKSEAVRLITTIYDQHTLPDNITNNFYDIMSVAVLEDTFIPVKTNAINFWQKVINRELSDEGIIDGEFPDFTFSKKLKKIIKFDERARKDSLDRILQNLSELGCLTAFLYALNFPDTSLTQTAVNSIKPFIQLLRENYFVSPQEHNTRIYSEPTIEPSVDSGYSTNISNIFSPYPASLYDDIIDMQESLVPNPQILEDLFEDSLEAPARDQFNEFINFVENFKFFEPDKINKDSLKDVLDSILG